MVTVKDTVHDHITVDGVGAALLDTPPVQRLRHISQLGTVQLVYPSANHTRFEHSLGVYHLARRALDHLGIEGRRADRIEAAAMLHDVGHGPFSHNLEALTHRRTGKYHDDVRTLVTDGVVGDTLRDHDVDPSRVASLIAGEGPYAGLISGELDVDRMDYLVRDAYHTGVPYGTIDTGRFVRELAFVEGAAEDGGPALVVDEGNVQTAESLLLARALMNPVVYTHHVARISKAMVRRAAADLLDTTATTAEELRRMDDHDFLAAIRACPATADLSRRYDERALYKRAVWAEYDDVPQRVRDADHAETLRRSHGRDPRHSGGADDARVDGTGDGQRRDPPAGAPVTARRRAPHGPKEPVAPRGVRPVGGDRSRRTGGGRGARPRPRRARRRGPPSAADDARRVRHRVRPVHGSERDQ
jgi:HD superfamily phosphohydrolase